MKIIIAKNEKEMSVIAADIIAKQIQVKPDSVLGLATGSTPIGVYKELINMYKDKKIDFSNIKSINLDEYIGLDGKHYQSYRYFMNNNLFNHININPNNTFVPNGMADDYNAECLNYENILKCLNGVDLQILGIGTNGHIGFNEPQNKLKSKTHVTNLKDSTIRDNARFFENIEDVPTRAITMGVGSILKAKQILLLASGEKKAEIIYKLINSDIDTLLPASMLHTHNNVTLVIDEEAAKFLNNNLTD